MITGAIVMGLSYMLYAVIVSHTCLIHQLPVRHFANLGVLRALS